MLTFQNAGWLVLTSFQNQLRPSWWEVKSAQKQSCPRLSKHDQYFDLLIDTTQHTLIWLSTWAWMWRQCKGLGGGVIQSFKASARCECSWSNQSCMMTFNGPVPYQVNQAWFLWLKVLSTMHATTISLVDWKFLPQRVSAARYLQIVLYCGDQQYHVAGYQMFSNLSADDETNQNERWRLQAGYKPLLEHSKMMISGRYNWFMKSEKLSGIFLSHSDNTNQWCPACIHWQLEHD